VVFQTWEQCSTCMAFLLQAYHPARAQPCLLTYYPVDSMQWQVRSTEPSRLLKGLETL